MVTLTIGDLVLCPRLGEEEFEIVSENNQTREYSIKSQKTGKVQQIYKVHCSAGPPEMRIRSRRRRQEMKLARATKIGNPTPKKR